MGGSKKAARFEIEPTVLTAALAGAVLSTFAALFSIVFSIESALWIAAAGSLAAVVCIILDIAPRRPKFMSLIGRREAAELCRLFVEHSPVFIFLKDDKLRHLLLSRNYETVLGKPLEQMIGKGTDALFSAEDAARLDEADKKVLRDGEPVDVINESNGRVYRTLEFPIMRHGRPAYLAGFTVDITEQKKAEEQVLQSLREKEALIRELYHRTKNTLQVIRSMLELQVEECPSGDFARRLVKDAEDRIQAIALVHQMLYESQDLSRIPIKDYVSELAMLVYRSFGVSEDRVALDLCVDDQSIVLDTAVPIGLILNELMTNSLKHAFPNRRKGCIKIKITNDCAGVSSLRYEDDGVGVPPGFDFYNGETLGLKLIRSIGSQINGDVRFESSGGVACSISFRAAEPKLRANVVDAGVAVRV
jgi:PAS domain S-box-containing protein